MSAADEARARARAIWSGGDYDAVAERLWPVGERLARRAGVDAHSLVLDVACGTGNAAIAAAQAGATVVGVDVTPELFAAGRRRAAEAGVEVTWVEGDAHALPFEADRFNAVLSTFGVMFAAEHRTAAVEIARVLEPGGVIGLCAWTPESGNGQLLRVVAAHAAPPPGLVSPPTLWGDPEHVESTFQLAEAEVEWEFERHAIDSDYRSVDDCLEFHETHVPPLVRAREALEAEGRWPALRADLHDLFTRLNVDEGIGCRLSNEYLLAVGRQAAG